MTWVNNHSVLFKVMNISKYWCIGTISINNLFLHFRCLNRSEYLGMGVISVNNEFLRFRCLSRCECKCMGVIYVNNHCLCFICMRIVVYLCGSPISFVCIFSKPDHTPAIALVSFFLYVPFWLPWRLGSDLEVCVELFSLSPSFISSDLV